MGPLAFISLGHQSWVAALSSVTVTRRTNRTSSRGTAVVCRTPRSASSTSAARRRLSMTSRTALTLCPTSSSRSLARPSKLAALLATSTCDQEGSKEEGATKEGLGEEEEGKGDQEEEG